MSGFEIFGVVAGVIGFVPLICEVRNALIMLARTDGYLEKLACEIVDTMNKHADFYQKFKASLNDQDIAQSLKRMESLLQSMKDRCDEERRRRASVRTRMKDLLSCEDLEKDICHLRDRLNEEHRSWTDNVSLRIYQHTQALQKQLAEAQSVIVQQQAQNHSLTQQLIEHVITEGINALSAEFKSVSAYVPRRRGLNMLLTAEEVHGLQNKPPELIIRKWAGFNTFQVCSPAYRIDMRSIREFYERNFTPTSTRNESLTGPLRDAVDCIFEHLENEECSLAHLVRAVSILLWLVGKLEDNGISLDRQTRDEVEACAVGLTREYLQRGRYNGLHVIWALEWASTRVIKEIAPPVPHSLIEYQDDPAPLPRPTRLVALAGLRRLAPLRHLEHLIALARLWCLPHLAGLADLADLAGLTGFAGLPPFAGLAGLERLGELLRLGHLAGVLGDLNSFPAIPLFGSLARLALNATPGTNH